MIKEVGLAFEKSEYNDITMNYQKENMAIVKLRFRLVGIDNLIKND